MARILEPPCTKRTSSNLLFVFTLHFHILTDSTPPLCYDDLQNWLFLLTIWFVGMASKHGNNSILYLFAAAFSLFQVGVLQLTI